MSTVLDTPTPPPAHAPEPAGRPSALPGAPAGPRPGRRPGLGAPVAARPARRHRPAVPVGPGRLRAGPTPSTPPPCRPARRTGRRSSTAPRTPANSITVDKPPASLWVMALVGAAVRAQLLVAARAAGADGRRHRRRRCTSSVRRVVGPGAGLLAGAAMALTPVAVLMFRFDNPDALLVLLHDARRLRARPGRWRRRACAGWSLRRRAGRLRLPDQDAAGAARRPRRSRWSTWSPPRRRCGRRVAAPARRRLAPCWCRPAGGSRSSSWCPASWRPYIGGSQTNSVWELIWGYNGLGRLTGDETGSVGAAARRRHWGETGIARLFGAEIGGQVAWLLPAALVLLVAGLVAARPRAAHRPAPRRAAHLGQLAGGHRADLQPDGRHLPRVLHGGPGPGDRGAGRHRRRPAVAAARGASWARIVLALDPGRHRGLVVRAAATGRRTSCPG